MVRSAREEVAGGREKCWEAKQQRGAERTEKGGKMVHL